MAIQFTQTFVTNSGLQFAFTSGAPGQFYLQIRSPLSSPAPDVEGATHDLTVDELVEMRTVLTTLIRQGGKRDNAEHD